MTRMNIKAVIFFFIIFTAILNSCSKSEECHNTMMLKNSSANTIYYVSTLKEGFFNFDPTNETYSTDFKVLKNESKKVRIGMQLSCWEQVIESAGGYLYIYIYDANYLDITEWQEAKNKHIKKYVLSVKDLQKMNWVINFTQ